MKNILKYLCFSTALVFASCAHYPEDGNGGGSGSIGNPDGGTDGGDCGGSSCPTDGGTDGGSGGVTDGGSCGTCPQGEVCDGGKCVCDGGGSDGTCGHGKTLLCHYPPGNPGNRHDICVGDPAVPAHLAHGDTLGACP